MERDDWLASTDPRRAAAAWHAVTNSATLPESDRSAFADWLQKSPAHLAEYLRLSAVREQLRHPGVFDGISLEELRTRIGANVEMLHDSEALALSSPPNTAESIHKLESSKSSGSGTGSRSTGTGSTAGSTGSAGSVTQRRRFGHRRGLAIAATLLLVCASGWLAWHDGLLPWSSPSNSAATYVTAVGEQRSIVLPDGSIAELNTRSTLELHFNEDAREATLREGEAVFRVAKDARRAFRVYSGGAIVQAIGTAFTVRREVDQTMVTVLEGRVSVAPSVSGRPQYSAPSGRNAVSRADPPGVELAAGQRLAVASGRSIDTRSIERVDTTAALAWQARRLIFDDLPLDAVVAEFNRYNLRPMRVAGADLGTRSITGVFNANDPDSFLTFLEGRGGVSVDRSGSDDIVIGPRARTGGEPATF